VRFTPTTLGAGEAKITLSDNELSPTAIALSGTGASTTPALAPFLPSILGALGAPVITNLRETSKSWHEGNALAQISAGKHGKRKLPHGTTFSFNLDEPASVTFTFTAPTSQSARSQRASRRRRASCTQRLAPVRASSCSISSVVTVLGSASRV